VRRVPAVVWVMLAAALPRLAAIVVLGDRLLEPRQDQFVFAELAAGVAEGKGLVLDAERFAAKAAAWRGPALREWVAEPGWAFGLVRVGGKTSAYEPLYPYTLGAAVRLGMPVWLAARWLNLVFGVAAAAAAFALGRRLFGGAAAWIAGLGVALYPAYIYYGLLAMGEAAHVALLAILLAAFYTSGNSRSSGAVVFGLAGAAFFLTRAIALPLGVLLLAYNCALTPRRAKTVFVFVTACVFALAVAPWVYRNYAVHGTFALAPSRGGVNLWMRNNPRVLALEPGELGADAEKVLRTVREPELLAYPAFGAAGELERDRILRGRMVRFVEANPGFFARMCVRRFVNTVKPYGPSARGFGQKSAAAVPYALALAFGAVGLGVARRRRTLREALPLAGVFAFYLLYHAVVHGGVRYRLPADLCLITLAGGGAAACAARLREKWPKRKP